MKHSGPESESHGNSFSIPSPDYELEMIEGMTAEEQEAMRLMMQYLAENP